jgi:glutamate-ammonia-ligase adenylyltransferase
VFRVDLALRPNGNSGPPAVSLGALEEYFQVQGREWERFAWLKSRVIAPREAIDSGSARVLGGTVVCHSCFAVTWITTSSSPCATLHRQIRDHAARRSAGHPERANDVKLSRGGIREIEFTVQLLQVVRGGQFPELRTRPTLDALQRLARAGLMPQATAQALADAYVFLRRVEHRIQYLDDQQTHVLPTQDGDLGWIAQRSDLRAAVLSCPNWTAIANWWRRSLTSCWLAPANRNARAATEMARACHPTSKRFWSICPKPCASASGTGAYHPRVAALRDDARVRLIRLVQRTALWVREGRISEEAAVRLVDWIEPLLRRESYLAMLLERPSVHERLLRLLGSARWPAHYLLQHPGVIDELASDFMLEERFSAGDFERELEDRRNALRRTGEDDEEGLLNLLRRAHHAEVFRTLARDVEGQLSVEQVADDLSAMADIVLRVTARWCWERLRNKHRDEPQFGIIGYGKLGGKELGYGSDLDIVFVYEDDDERAPETYSAFVRKLINWLTVKTGEGDLFEIDTALRPNGGSGLLVTTFEAYANYQQQRGSNTAWTWEHQAMTRARFVLGSEPLRERFDAVRLAVIGATRDTKALHDEIVAMRERVRSAHPVTADRFDVKHSIGGMVDAEFAMQFLVLSKTATHPELADNVGNIALMHRSEQAGLVPQGIGSAAADAYRELRRVQHRARLNEEPTQVAPRELATERDAVTAFCKAVFG